MRGQGGGGQVRDPHYQLLGVGIGVGSWVRLLMEIYHERKQVPSQALPGDPGKCQRLSPAPRGRSTPHSYPTHSPTLYISAAFITPTPSTPLRAEGFTALITHPSSLPVHTGWPPSLRHPTGPISSGPLPPHSALTSPDLTSPDPRLRWGRGTQARE